ncbi:Nucleolar protein 12 [Penicillium angulare]|uniref:Nucleolar protein 12 n=1 Tax=Penicillium angulare TaxID=116970 RepID=A0A9W9K127_9EURO|nr:Nucleolar protein 12 [Penicillium angulare]
MGKKSKSQSKADSAPAASDGLSLLSSKSTTTLDPTLSSLFDKSSGPVKAPAVQYVNVPPKSTKQPEADEEDEDVLSSADGSLDSEDEAMEDAPEASESASAEEQVPESQGRKRKRGAAGEDLEETYMRRIAKEEEKAEEKRKSEQSKRQKPSEEEAENDSSESKDSEAEDSEEDDDGKSAVPVHESVSGTQKANEVEKSNRTVFLGNVSTTAIKSKSAKKTLLRHLATFCSSLPEESGPHKVESIRFRSIPFASGGGLPKRASFARREILDETTTSTNAYAVYSTLLAARKAPAALNGTVVLERHLRVDSVAHPASIDNKRCVFVGNLDFVDQEGAVEDESGKKKKVRAPADVEEGLWRTFNEHTGDKDKKTGKKSVEFVRVIRDRSTRVGKGFAYVQFYDGTGVEQALLLNEKKFPPMLPRKLRVTRARKIAKKREDTGAKDSKLAEAQKTLQGRAGKLLGRAGAAKVKENANKTIAGNSFVFEGHRATEGSNQLKVKTKSRGSKGSKAKKNARSSKRAAAYKAAGGQKP